MNWGAPDLSQRSKSPTHYAGYCVETQDYRGWVPFNVTRPPTMRDYFQTEAEAKAFRATLPREKDFLVFIKAAPEPRARKRKSAMDCDWLDTGRMHASGRRLTL